MRCVVETDWNVWDFGTVKEARAWYRRLVDYATSGRSDEGEPSDFVMLWRASDYYGETFGNPVEEFYQEGQ